MNDPNESEKYFGVNFKDTEIYPILLVIQNTGEDSYIIEKESASLTTEDAYIEAQKQDLKTALNMEKTGSSIAEPAAVATAAGILIFLPLAILAIPISLFGSNMTCNAQEIKRNMLENEFQTTTLSKGRSAHGFLYFQRPKAQNSGDKLILSVIANNLKMKKVDRFVFEISE